MITEASNINTAPAEVVPIGFRVICDHCSTGVLKSGQISTAFWQGDGLVVVRNIPAMVCPDCGEQYIDDLTVVQLDRMRGAGFAGLPAIDKILVPVLDYGRFE